MDQGTVEAILAIARALDRSRGSPAWALAVNIAHAQPEVPDTESIHRYMDLYALAVAAEELDGGPADIWLDEQTLVYLRTGKHAPPTGSEERKRVLKRATRYVWHPPQLSARPFPPHPAA